MPFPTGRTTASGGGLRSLGGGLLARGSHPTRRTAPRSGGLDRPGSCGHRRGADHMPGLVDLKLGTLLNEAIERRGMNYFAFQQADREQALLLDHLGACERIAHSRMPLVYSIKIRQFITLFLLALPFALLGTFNSVLLVPSSRADRLSDPAADQTGIELEDPFSTRNLQPPAARTDHGDDRAKSRRPPRCRPRSSPRVSVTG